MKKRFFYSSSKVRISDDRARERLSVYLCVGVNQGSPWALAFVQFIFQRCLGLPLGVMGLVNRPNS